MMTSVGHSDANDQTPLAPVEEVKRATSPRVGFAPPAENIGIPPPSRHSTRSTAKRKQHFLSLPNFKKKSPSKTALPWIHKAIQFRVCNTFIPTDKDPNKCQCGGCTEEHVPGVKTNTGTWYQKSNTVRRKGYFFGGIKFVDEDATHQPDFVRIDGGYMDYRSTSNKVFELFEIQWKLDRPNLLISVTGGAQDFVCPPELERRFKRGLVRAAKSTNAWIFTGGTNTGVMKLVGEAVRGTSFGSQIITIGVATWGIVKNREELGSLEQRNKSLFSYHTKDCVQRSNEKGAFLDPNHTHFMLVDDGTQYAYGKEIHFRATLEQKLSERYAGEDGTTLPQICILVEGGPNSVRTVLETIKLNNPALIIAGSGRAADVIAHAYKISALEEAFNSDGDRIKIRSLSEDSQDSVEQLIRTKFPNIKEEDKNNVLKWCIEVIKFDKYVTVYELSDSKDFDLALLAAIIRGIPAGTTSIASMRLAITWNRPLLASNMILPFASFSEKDLNNLLKYAITSDRTEFIKMILDQGIDMKHFLTHDMLVHFYINMNENCIVHKKLRKLASCKQGDFNIDLRHVGKLMEFILEGTYRSDFTTQDYAEKKDDLRDNTFENPYDVMVVYAVLSEAHDTAKLFWSRCKTPIATALIAYKLNIFLYGLQKNSLNQDEENELILQEWAKEFERLATGTMRQCYKDRNYDTDMWKEVLSLPHKSWGNLNLIDLSQTVHAMEFTAQSAVQNWLSDVWLGDIHSTHSTLHVLIAALIPVVGPLTLRYTLTTELVEELTEQQNEAGNEAGIKLKDISAVEEGLDDLEVDGQLHHHETRTVANLRKRHVAEKLKSFYTAPKVKFTQYVIIYLLFIGTFVYTLLVGDQKLPVLFASQRYSILELVLLLYVMSTIPIEIKQIKESIPSSLRIKLLTYVSDFFNVLDLLGALLFIIAFILKGFVQDVDDGVPVRGNFHMYNTVHLLRIVSFLFYCFRTTQMFRIQSKMGPKIVMIGKMLIDLVFFIFLMLVFLLAFGVAAQSLMRPNNSKFTGRTIFDVVFKPYLHVFGELALDGYQDEMTEGHCANDANCNFDTIYADNLGQIHYYILMATLAIYLMMVNILLVNLLIAIFSKTYEDIQQESDTIWKVQRAGMIIEYQKLSAIPQPFSLLKHMWQLIKFISRLCSNACMERVLVPEEDESRTYRVSMIEAESREEFLSNIESADSDSQNSSKAIAELKEQLLLMKSMLQANITSSNSAATVVPDTAQKVKKAEGKPARPTTAISQLTRIKPLRVHCDSRRSPYPACDVTRFPVPDDKVNWTTRFKDYDPVQYTAPEVLNAASDEVDPQITNDTRIKFNKVDKTTKDSKTWTIDRTSYHGQYQVINGVPKNPKGRTGMTGRGLLYRWGPNHAADTVVTRWKRDGNDKIVMCDGKPVIEFVAILRKDTNEWAIPGGRVKPNERVFDAIKREFSEEALAKLSRSIAEQEGISIMLQEHFNLGITIYKGYVDDPRNTDNAWIETIAVNYHDSTGTSFSHFPLKAIGDDSNSMGVQWIAIDHNIDLYANHEWILEKVCYHRDAYNPIKEMKIKRKDTENNLWMTVT